MEGQKLLSTGKRWSTEFNLMNLLEQDGWAMFEKNIH